MTDIATDEPSPSRIDLLVEARPELAPVMYAMWARAEGRRLGRELADAGIPVMVLKGPELQDRLYGTPAAYQSSDIDVLVHGRDERRARAVLRSHDWNFEPGNGVLWRLSAAASYERAGFRADLHWGLHAAHLPARLMRPLERAMWERAKRAASGFLEPDDESLFVYLAVHAVGHDFERPEWTTNVHRAAERVRDWARVWSVARRARVTEAVRAAMSEQLPGARVPVLDGPVGRAAWWATYVARGHVIPQAVRDRVRDAVALRREGFGLLGIGGNRIRVGDLDLLVEPGVFEPQGVTVRGVDFAKGLLNGAAPASVVDVGTGSGSVAITAARRWPAAQIHGVDVSPRAVRCARANARRHHVANTSFHVGHLLRPIPESLLGSVDLVFSNVPYVSPVGGKDAGELHVPLSTIYGTEVDGLGYMRDLCRELPRFMRPGGVWVFQIGDPQLRRWGDYLSTHGFEPILPDVPWSSKAVVAGARFVGGVS